MPSEQTRIRRLEAAAVQSSIEEVISLSVEDQIALAEAIVNPPEPNEALRKAAKAYKRLVVESR